MLSNESMFVCVLSSTENNVLLYEIAFFGFIYKYKFDEFEMIEFNLLKPCLLLLVCLWV